MAVTQNEETVTKLQLLRNQGMIERYKNKIPGFNNRMTEISAAIGLVQLKKLARWTEKRIENAQFLNKHLSGVTIPFVDSNAKHVYHQYTIRVDGHSREKFQSALKLLGISSDVYYPVPVHKLEAYNLPVFLEQSQQASETVLSIPVHQRLSERDLSRIVDSVNKVARAGS